MKKIYEDKDLIIIDTEKLDQYRRIRVFYKRNEYALSYEEALDCYPTELSELNNIVVPYENVFKTIIARYGFKNHIYNDYIKYLEEYLEDCLEGKIDASEVNIKARKEAILHQINYIKERMSLYGKDQA